MGLGGHFTAGKGQLTSRAPLPPRMSPYVSFLFRMCYTPARQTFSCCVMLCRVLHVRQDKKDSGRSRTVGSHHTHSEHSKREEELLEEEVQPKNTPLDTTFLPILLFTR